MKYSEERIRAATVGHWGSFSREERFWGKVDATGDCWLWTGGGTRGYGTFEWPGIGNRAHRVAYILLVGPIPDDLVLDHLCRVKSCVNPDHLEAVAQGVNVRRGRAGYHTAPNKGNRKTHCVHGHAYTPENTMHLSQDRHQCRKCHQLRNQAYARAKANQAGSQRVTSAS